MNLLLGGMNWICNTVKQILEWLVIGIVVVLLGSVLWGVITRTELAGAVGLAPSLWTEELARLLLIWVTFLGAAICFDQRQHLGLDYFASLLHPRARRRLQLLVEFIIVVFSAVALIHGGFMLVGETLAAGQTTAAMQLKMGYVYLAAPIAGFATILFCLRRVTSMLAGKNDDDAGSPSLSLEEKVD